MDEVGGVRFLVLGPVQAYRAGARLALGRRRERAMLAVLLVHAGELVPVPRLVDLLWDGAPPRSPRASLHSHMSRLRACLDPDGSGASGIRLSARDGGYLAEVDRTAVDAHEFTDLVEWARAEPDPARRGTLLRQALALWRGPALADAGSGLMRRRVAGDLEELRLTATELALDADLDRGLHREVAGEASRLVGEHPLREGLWARLALARYRSGRRADALDALAQARQALVAELGLDPSRPLGRLQVQILNDDPELNPPAPAAHRGPVRLLPMDIAEFTGRDAELRLLIGEAAEGTATAPAVWVVVGMPGVGKTRLALHAAHRLAGPGRYDDVQLWADLRGYDAHQPPADPAGVLATFLALLGVPAEHQPADLDARAALYRSQLAGRPAIVLLDNAANPEQVRPLLPGSPTCLTLVTARRHLSTLEGTRTVRLDVLSRPESVRLLARIAGPDRVAAQPRDAASIGELCGHLPIAVALAARRLQAHPARPLRDVVDWLERGDRSPAEPVRAAFDLSYQALTPSQRRMFRLLGVFPGAELAVPQAAALAGLPPDQANAVLDELLDEHLVQQTTPGRYRVHDLIRAYAAEQADREEPPDQRHAALARLVRHYLAGAWQATRVLYRTETRRIDAEPPAEAAGHAAMTSPAQAIAWADANLDTMVALAQRAANLPGDTPRLVVRLVLALYRPLASRGLVARRVRLGELAAGTAQRLGDRRGAAQALEDLGEICSQVGRHTEAIGHLEQALAAWRELRDQVGEAACLTGLGAAYRRLHRFDEAVARLEQALAASRVAGWAAGQATTLNQLGLAYQGLGRFERAIDCLQDGAALHRRFNSPAGEAIALANLGWAHQRAGRPEEATGHHRTALATFRRLGDRYNEAEQLWALAQIHHRLGDETRARTYWRESANLLIKNGELTPDQADALLSMPVPETPKIIQLNT